MSSVTFTSPSSTFDSQFIPTLCVILAAYFIADGRGVTKLQFFSLICSTLLLWGLITFSVRCNNEQTVSKPRFFFHPLSSPSLFSPCRFATAPP